MSFKFCDISMALSDRSNLGWISLRRLMTVTAKSSISELKHSLKRPTWTRIGNLQSRTTRQRILSPREIELR